MPSKADPFLKKVLQVTKDDVHPGMFTQGFSCSHRDAHTGMFMFTQRCSHRDDVHTGILTQGSSHRDGHAHTEMLMLTQGCSHTVVRLRVGTGCFLALFIFLL